MFPDHYYYNYNKKKIITKAINKTTVIKLFLFYLQCMEDNLQISNIYIIYNKTRLKKYFVITINISQ